jgi:hypothetical protein
VCFLRFVNTWLRGIFIYNYVYQSIMPKRLTYREIRYRESSVSARGGGYGNRMKKSPRKQTKKRY